MVGATVVVRSRSWCSMLMVVEGSVVVADSVAVVLGSLVVVARVKHDTTHLAGHR